VLVCLTSLPSPDRYRELLLDPESHLRPDEQAWVFGEALPAGLVLAASAR